MTFSFFSFQAYKPPHPFLIQNFRSEPAAAACSFSGQKNRHHGGTKRNTVTLTFIAVSRSRRAVLMIKKMAVTASVSGKKYIHMPGSIAVPDFCLQDCTRKKTRHL